MQPLQDALTTLQADVAAAMKALGYDALQHRLTTLQTQMEAPDMWSNQSQAKAITTEHARLAKRLAPWQALAQSVDDMVDLALLNDASIAAELEAQYQSAQQAFTVLKDELKFGGPYDDNDVIMNIYAGAGGTDAQDWAQMLLRMYVRWAEKNGYTVITVDESASEEAGIKSVTLEISGSFAYGKLKGEHGVHRLVRLSPFNADNLRQTSFAKVDILPKVDRPEDLVIDDKDMRIDVYRAGGHGGQSVNTTDSAVRITHIPTGIAVAIQNERSQLQNKETAMTILRSRLIQLQMEQHKEHLEELKGPNQSAEWGNQIRSYVLHPYKQVKDLRSRYETSDTDGVLSGNIDPLIAAYLEHTLGK
jgi:peptide chain release factor 2